MTTDGDTCSGTDFEIAYTQDRVELVLHAREADQPASSAETILNALKSSALASIDSMAVARALSIHSRSPHTRSVTTVGYPDVRGAEPPCAIIVSMDRLAAFVVPVVPAAAPAVPPDATGEAATREAPAGEAATGDAATEPTPMALTAAELRRRLSAAGVVRGLLDGTVDEYADGMVLDDIRCVARGQRAVLGANARLDYHIESEVPGAPTGAGKGSIDLHALSAHRFVVERTPLVTRRPPVAGVAGYDVLGAVLEPPPARDLDLDHVAGANTEVAGDELVATIAGRPVVNARGMVDVLPLFEVTGNLDFHVGNIEFPGDVIVRGDVRPGFAIAAGGSVTVGGLVEGASITAGHDVTVLGTVGEHRTTLEVGGDLHARYLHTTDARVAGSVTVGTEIVSCSVTAERVTTGAQGRIVGGYVEAISSIDTGTVGSREGRPTEARVTSDAPDAVIRIRRVAEPGILLSVGGTAVRIRDEIAGASFWSAHGTLMSLPSNADVAAAEARRSEPAA